jgi:hypothetical protein
MDWISVKDRLPNNFNEVIVATDDGRVKSAVYMSNGKWNTFLNITHWMEYPEAPEIDVEIEVEEEQAKKRCGRKKIN